MRQHLSSRATASAPRPLAAPSKAAAVAEAAPPPPEKMPSTWSSPRWLAPPRAASCSPLALPRPRLPLAPQMEKAPPPPEDNGTPAAQAQDNADDAADADTNNTTTADSCAHDADSCNGTNGNDDDDHFSTVYGTNNAATSLSSTFTAATSAEDTPPPQLVTINVSRPTTFCAHLQVNSVALRIHDNNGDRIRVYDPGGDYSGNSMDNESTCDADSSSEHSTYGDCNRSTMHVCRETLTINCLCYRSSPLRIVRTHTRLTQQRQQQRLQRAPPPKFFCEMFDRGRSNFQPPGRCKVSVTAECGAMCAPITSCSTVPPCPLRFPFIIQHSCAPHFPTASYTYTETRCIRRATRTAWFAHCI